MLMLSDHTARSGLAERFRVDPDRSIGLVARKVDLAVEPEFLLGRALIVPEAHEYTIAGKPTRMQPHILKVLVALHDKRGRVVSRDELIDRCWHRRIVGNDAINRCISLLRLFAAQSGGFHIETISGAGYRLVADVAQSNLEHGPRQWMMARAVAAVTVFLSATAFIERAPIRPSMSIRTCASRSSFAAVHSRRNAAPVPNMRTQLLASFVESAGEVGKRSGRLGKRSGHEFQDLR